MDMERWVVERETIGNKEGRDEEEREGWEGWHMEESERGGSEEDKEGRKEGRGGEGRRQEAWQRQKLAVSACLIFLLTCCEITPSDTRKGGGEEGGGPEEKFGAEHT